MVRKVDLDQLTEASRALLRVVTANKNASIELKRVSDNLDKALKNIDAIFKRRAETRSAGRVSS